jgi:NAD(P)-dependent dehydrogenase (short-subunit alcohol dehydrogenase family)
MLSMGLINGKVAILTGSGRGIGAATAKMFAAEGEEVQLGVLDRMRQMAPLLIPLGRPGTPEEAAGPVLFLASPLSNYISGIVLEVTGGRAI